MSTNLIGTNYTTQQHLTLTVVLSLSSAASMICSGRIIAFCSTKLKSGGPYFRIIAGISIADCFFSAGVFLQRFLIPSDMVSWPWAFGNQASCSFAGFLLTDLSITTAFYNAFLSTVFLLMVRFNWKQSEIGRSFEGAGHALAWIVPLFSMVPAVATGNINPGVISQICTIVSLPQFCDPNAGNCIRGEAAEVYSVIHRVQVTAAAIIGILATVWVYWSYRQQLKASQRFDFSQQLSSQRQQLLNRVAFRAVFYSLAYLNTFFWPNMASGLARMALNGAEFNPSGLYAFVVVGYIFYPLQGFFNYFIFTRHTYQDLKTIYPSASFWNLHYRVWKGETKDSQRRCSFSTLQRGNGREQEAERSTDPSSTGHNIAINDDSVGPSSTVHNTKINVDSKRYNMEEEAAAAAAEVEEVRDAC